MWSASGQKKNKKAWITKFFLLAIFFYSAHAGVSVIAVTGGCEAVPQEMFLKMTRDEHSRQIGVLTVASCPGIFTSTHGPEVLERRFLMGRIRGLPKTLIAQPRWGTSGIYFLNKFSKAFLASSGRAGEDNEAEAGVEVSFSTRTRIE